MIMGTNTIADAAVRLGLDTEEVEVHCRFGRLGYKTEDGFVITDEDIDRFAERLAHGRVPKRGRPGKPHLSVQYSHIKKLWDVYRAGQLIATTSQPGAFHEEFGFDVMR